MLKRTLFLSLALALTMGSQAKVRLPQMIADNMILQQQTDARLWGWAKPGQKVKVTTSWTKQVYTAQADSKGNWLVKVNVPKASYTPLSITFDDGDKVTVKNVLSGEVWVCAGHSNMEMPVRGFGNCPVEGSNEAVIDASQYKGVHYVKIPSVMSSVPLEDANCHWDVIGPNTVSDCSATGYFFGRLLNKALDIPVGLVVANKGGTRVESWLNRDNLTKYTDEVLDSTAITKKFSWDYHYPLLWGNGTFHPILNYTVKGIIFYQGCSNVGDPGNRYSERLKLLVEQWRQEFGLGELPFYFVQIAPYYQDADGVNGLCGALLREQQVRASKIIPNSDIVCTNDLVYPWETQQIHHSQKRQVGERLAFIALNKNYGMQNVMCESSQFKDLRISNDTCYVHLTNDYGGISRYEDLQGFEVAGSDKVFHKANAYYFWKKGIIITSPDVKQPVAVRYCFRNFQLGNVKNQSELPLFPFRTDNW